MANTTRPSTAMLPMADIAEVLKEEHSFSSKEDVAKDTQMVDGTKAELIAIAATDAAGNLIGGRQTVENALKLGGVKADQYMTREDGSRIEAFGNNVSEVFADEITLLRDELYQMRAELTRKGFLNEYGVYSGFQDFFSPNNKKFRFAPMGPVTLGDMGDGTVNTIIPSADLTEYHVGDWLVIHTVHPISKIVKNFLVQVSAIVTNQVEFHLLNSTAGVPSNDAQNIENIYRYLGEYNEGSFSFSEMVAEDISSKERLTMLNDDSNTTVEKIVENNAGFGVSFNVPAMSAGALKTFSIFARNVDNNNTLMCYVIEESNIGLIRDLQSPDTASLILAKAPGVMEPSSTSLPRLNFNFKNDETGAYPTLVGKKRYAFVLVAGSASEGAPWEIQFGKAAVGTSGDLQTNNDAYAYKAGTGLVKSTLIGDMIFILTTLEVRTNQESPNQEGLYTSETIELPSGIEISRARLTMRVNREGNFIAAAPGTYGNGSPFGVDLDADAGNGTLPSDYGIRAGEVVAIGTEIRKAITDCRSMVFSIDKGVNVPSGKKTVVHRIGYKAFIRAYKKIWDAATNKFVTSNHQMIEMPLIAIMPDRMKPNIKRSDRLIFEAEFRDETTGLPLDVNVLELQLIWSSNSKRDDMVANKDLVGRIHDLSLSFDRTL